MRAGEAEGAGSARVRLATPADAAAVQAIYAPVVQDTVASFEFEPPTATVIGERIAATLPALPWLVIEDDCAVLGYAYAAPHRERAAYRWSVDVSVYLDAAARGRGFGRRLYEPLLALLEVQRYRRAHAGIALPNPASVALHEALGFTPVGVYRGVGWKAGAWHDVGWWQRPLSTAAGPPAEPLTVDQVGADTGWPEAVTKTER